MALDPLAIASDGYLSKHKWTQSVASRGYLSVYALVVIEVPPGGVAGEAFGYLYTDDKSLAEKEAQLHQEDSEIMLIIQIFMMKWN